MRQWLSLTHLLRTSFCYFPLRCLLVIEELETRAVPNRGPVVFPPDLGTPQPPENTSFTFNNDSCFNIYDSFDVNQTFDAVLSATHGTISVDLPTAQGLGLTVTSDGTAAVDVRGQLDNINNLLVTTGITFTPTAYYSGDATVTVTATDLEMGGPPGSATVDLQVQPVASNITLSVNPTGILPLQSAPFAFPSGFVTVSPWPDRDGSETTTVTVRLDAANPDAFTLSAGGAEITPQVPGVWEVSGSDPVALQALLDSLVLTPPPGFSGVVGLSVDAMLVDTASYTSAETPATSVSFAGPENVALRFFVGQSVTSPPVFAQEGETMDLGGRFEVADPDELPGDVHTLTLSVPSGTLTLNAFDVPGGLLAGEQTSGTETTIQLTGTIAEINEFLATPGCMTYTADSPFFAGRIPLTLTLQNQLGPVPSGLFDDSSGMPSGSVSDTVVADGIPATATGVASLFFLPSAERAVPSAFNVTTNENTPISLSIGVSRIANPEGTESELIVLEGVPAGATLNHGTDLGNGEWALSVSDLSDLTFTPPPDQTGVFTLTVKVVVTNAPADISTTATDTESTTFTVTVVPTSTSTSIELPPEPVDPPVTVLTGPLESSPATGEAPSSSTSTGENTDVQANTVAIFYATASVSNVNFQSSVSETRVAFAPTQSTPFTPTEAPLPIYSGGEKHPLPPVLPLDQTLPVAGFTESGGDSFALLDALYRGTVQPNQPTTVSRADSPTPETVITVPEVPPATSPKAVKTATPPHATPVAVPSDQESAVPSSDDANPEGEWRLAASVLVGPFAAWLWFSRQTKKRFRRSVYNILNLFQHRSTERTP